MKIDLDVTGKWLNIVQNCSKLVKKLQPHAPVVVCLVFLFYSDMIVVFHMIVVFLMIVVFHIIVVYHMIVAQCDVARV